jgi:hypothetical protein
MDQKKAIESLQQNQTAIANTLNSWLPWIQKHVNNLYAEVGSLKQTDVVHDKTFKSMQETDAKLQTVLDAFRKVGETTSTEGKTQ